MGVCESGAHDGVGDHRLHAVHAPDHDDAGQVLEVDLVDDPHARRYDAEAAKHLLGPAQQGVALVNALVLALDVAGVGVGAAEGVDLHRMVDDEVHVDERVDSRRIPSGPLHGAAHGGEVDHRRNPGEVVEKDAGGDEGALAVLGRGLAIPARQRSHALLLAEALSGVAEEILEEDLHRHGEAGDVPEPPLFEGCQPMVGQPTAKLGPGAEAILRHLSPTHRCA